MRVFIYRSNGTLHRFAVLLECEYLPDDWRCVAKYDNWHDYVHRHRYLPSGEEIGIPQERFNSMDLHQALDWATDDLTENHESYVTYFRDQG